ncbi:MAG TPA: hypothetical protein VMZ28_09590 [Kofleriaceae bacterium]|nr:hypothetical protein [Kofleriaceae bacterium]
MIVVEDALSSRVPRDRGAGGDNFITTPSVGAERILRRRKSACKWWCMNDELRVERLNDDDLLARTGAIATRGRRNDAALVAHMAEVDARRLYLRERGGSP